jgi:hypothetical protein
MAAAAFSAANASPPDQAPLDHVSVVLTHFVIAGLDPAIHPLRKKFL